MNKNLDDTLVFPCGIIMKNRFMLAPMTNTQSHNDGSLSDEEFHWLTMRAKGQFGLVMTCASHIHPAGKGFPRQLGIYSDSHISGHQRLVNEIKAHGSLAVIQLHHAGMRSPIELINQPPICPSQNEEYGAREMSSEEIDLLKNDFVSAAIRSKGSGYDGVEIHAAHGYILTQFLSATINKRKDVYGGDLSNRSRILFEIIDEIRAKCGNGFLIGVRVSPEKFGMDILEVKEICKKLIAKNKIDFIDISLWDFDKLPDKEQYEGKSLLSHFIELDFKNILLTVAGKIQSGNDVKRVLDMGVDFVAIGRSAILHHDFPLSVMSNINFEPKSTPVSEQYLTNEGLGDRFIEYMKRWPNFVQ